MRARVLALLLAGAPAQASDEVLACRGIPEAGLRLSCYDALAARLAPPRFSGQRSAVTEPFTLSTPHLIRFRSEGVIFVLYLMDEAGNVIQNLHLGGGGEGQYRIEKPGTYHLRINGAEGWRIWLDPD